MLLCLLLVVFLLFCPLFSSSHFSELTGKISSYSESYLLTHFCFSSLRVITDGRAGCCSNKTCDLCSCSHLAQCVSGYLDRWRPNRIRCVYTHTVCCAEWMSVSTFVLLPRQLCTRSMHTADLFMPVEVAHSHQDAVLSCMTELWSVFFLLSSGWSVLQIKSVASRKDKSEHKWLIGTSQLDLKLICIHLDATLLTDHTVSMRKTGVNGPIFAIFENGLCFILPPFFSAQTQNELAIKTVSRPVIRSQSRAFTLPHSWSEVSVQQHVYFKRTKLKLHTLTWQSLVLMPSNTCRSQSQHI